MGPLFGPWARSHSGCFRGKLFPRNCMGSMWTVIAVSQGGYASFPLLVLVPKPHEKGRGIHCLAPNTTAPHSRGALGVPSRSCDGC